MAMPLSRYLYDHGRGHADSEWTRDYLEVSVAVEK